MPRHPLPKRRQFTVRVPVDHAPLYNDAADRRGMNISDYLASVLADAHGLEQPPWLNATDQQEVLPETA